MSASDGVGADTVVSKRREVMRQIVENLRGDALNVAMEIGIESLYAEDGPQLLQDAILKCVFPVARHESKVSRRAQRP